MKKVLRATWLQCVQPMHDSSSTYVKRAAIGSPRSSRSRCMCDGSSRFGSGPSGLALPKSASISRWLSSSSAAMTAERPRRPPGSNRAAQRGLQPLE